MLKFIKKIFYFISPYYRLLLRLENKFVEIEKELKSNYATNIEKLNKDIEIISSNLSKQNEIINNINSNSSLSNSNSQKIYSLLSSVNANTQKIYKLLSSHNIDLQKVYSVLSSQNKNIERIYNLSSSGNNNIQKVYSLLSKHSSNIQKLYQVIDKQGFIINDINKNSDLINNIVKEGFDIQKSDLNIIFKYMSSGLELHPYKGYMHRILTADYHGAKYNHYIRYKYASTLIEPDSKVLDIACGVGYGSSLLAYETEVDSIVGVDLHDEVVTYAKRIFNHKKISFRTGDCLDQHLFEDEQFDIIISFETIEHVRYDEQLFANFYQWLKKGGIMIGSVPNESVMPFDKNMHTYHYKHYTEEDLLELCKQTGFNVRLMQYGDWEEVPVTTPAYTHIFVLEK